MSMSLYFECMNGLNYYEVGVFIGAHIAAMYFILAIGELLRCNYWCYVNESEGFPCYITLFWNLKPKKWYYLDGDAIAGGLLGATATLVIASVFWPLALLWFFTVGTAKIHRAILRIKKRVDRLDPQ